MYVYALHKGDFDFKYVGKTSKSLEYRLRNHKKSAKYYNRSAVQKWINESPWLVQIVMLEEVEQDDHVSEAKWIWALDTYDSGHNSTRTGGPGLTLDKWTKSGIDKLRVIGASRDWSDGRRENVSAAMRKHWESRSRLSETK